MFKIKKSIRNQLKIILLYSFKSFKKNLRFKKYNLGTTKFIKNRKRYNLRKRRTSNIINYTYLYTWSKIYIVMKHSYRYIQLHNLSNYSLVSRVLVSNLILSKFNSNNLVINYNTSTKNIFFNLTLFQKNKYHFYKSIFSHENITTLFFMKLNNNILSEGVIIFNNYVFKLLKWSDINQSIYFFMILINTLIKKIISIIISLRKALTLKVLSQKFLKC